MNKKSLCIGRKYGIEGKIVFGDQKSSKYTVFIQCNKCKCNSKQKISESKSLQKVINDIPMIMPEICVNISDEIY